MIFPSGSEFMAKPLLMPVVTFKTHLESQDVYFPRITVGFTFASGDTQLTDFSDAKL
jgi:hypothetical protein